MVYYLSYCDLRILQREGLKLESTIDKMYAWAENYIKSFYTEDRLVQEHIDWALQQLQTKKLTNPAKKHGNIPL